MRTFVVVKVPGGINRHEMWDQETGRLVAAGSTPAILAVARLFGLGRGELALILQGDAMKGFPE